GGRGGRALEVLGPQGGGGSGARGCVNRHVLAACFRRQIGRATKTAQPAHLRVGDHLCERRRDRRVEGVAARGQDGHARLSRQRLRRYNDAPHRSNGTPPRLASGDVCAASTIRFAPPPPAAPPQATTPAQHLFVTEHLLEHPEVVVVVNLLQLSLGEAAATQLLGEVGQILRR